MTLLEIQLLWGSSTCGRSIEQFVFDMLSKEMESLKNELLKSNEIINHLKSELIQRSQELSERELEIRLYQEDSNS